jgi:long-chain acyl-CoA synthetase
MKDQAFGLAALGFEPGDRLCVLGDNRPRLYGVQIAAQALGGVAVPLDANRSADELAAQVDRANARWLVLEAPEQLHRMTPLMPRMTTLAFTVAAKSTRAAASSRAANRTALTERSNAFQARTRPF